MLSTTVTIIQQINKGELKDYNRIQTDTHAYTIMAKTNRSKDIKKTVITYPGHGKPIRTSLN